MRHVPWESLGIGQVQAAADARQMLELCAQMRPDIVISDVRMPGMDGIELCKRLRDMLPRCRIIFLSGYSDKEYLIAAIEISAVSYVEKPVDIAELTRVLERAVAECGELSRDDRNAVDAALFAQFVSVLATGSRADVLDTAARVYASLKAEQTASLQALRNVYFQLAYQIAQRSQRAAQDSGFAETLHETLAACQDVQTLHADLLERIDGAFPVGSLGAELSSTVRQVIWCMEAELGNENLTIDMLARQVYLSPTYLANLFKKETGCTIGQYLLDLRMQRAKELLGDRMLRLYQVSQRVGYADANYFAKTFRRVVGMTPKEYREKMT